MDLPTIFEFYSEDTLIDSGSAVDGEVHFCLHGAVEVIASAFHEIGGDGRMMGYLLEVSRASVDPALVGLPQDRVERFLHGEVDEGTTHDAADYGFELLNGVGFYYFFEVEGAVAEGHGLSFDVAFSAENVDGQGDVQDAFSGEDIFAYSFNDEGENSSLLPHLFLIDVVQPS